jgi:multisubunit Na+/H+ antiporter MnhB subunit
MNETKWFLILFGIAGIVLTLIFPPNDYSQQTYTFIWNIPKGDVNVEEMTVQLVIFAGLPVILFFIFRERKVKRPRVERKFYRVIYAGIMIVLASVLLWWSEGGFFRIIECLVFIGIACVVIYDYVRYRKLRE